MFRQWWVIMFVLGLLSAAARCPALTRVALPPVGLSENPTVEEQVRATLGAFLHERLEECPSVMLAGRGRSAAIFSELTGGKRERPAGALLDAYSAYLPVDALITYTASAGTLRLTIARQDGEKTSTLPYKAANWGPVVYQAAEAVGTALGLAPGVKARLGENRLGDHDILQSYYLIPLTSASWPQNVGEAQLKALLPVLQTHPRSAALAALHLRGTVTLLNATSRQQGYADTALSSAQRFLPAVLGTPYEEEADALVRARPNLFEKDLLALAKGLIYAEIRAGDGLLEDIGESLIDEPPVTDAMRLGALRLLGVARSKSALEIIATVAREKSPAQREAAARALGYYEKADGLATLRALATDRDQTVAFAALVSLWRRGETPPALLPAARALLDATDARRRALAREVVIALGTEDDLPRLRELLADHAAETRLAAVRALARLRALAPHGAALVADPDETVVLYGLAELPPAACPPLTAPLQALANDPHGPIAEVARLALAPCRPAGDRAQLAFDLAVEHPYLRQRVVERLAARAEPWAVEELAQACTTNRHAQTRAHALARLLERDAERGRAQLARVLRDPYHWVRLHAAALAAVHATPAMAAELKVALAAERDEATRLFLEDALARAEGRPLPPPRPAAHRVDGTRNLSWMCGIGRDAEHSPFDAYYLFTPQVDEARKRAHAAGKIIFSRVSSVGNSGQIVVGQRYADSFWLAIDAALTPENLPYLDGVVFGEETMNMRTDTLWAEGWRPFCVEAGIDPARVKGDIDALNRYERRAWSHWAQERIIDGFNIMYDYVHMKYGKLRPGFKVATFLTEQGGSNVADLRWKFDVGGAYDYKGDPRMAAYTAVRRIKTLWPDRPVIWLSLGIGGYEMNPVRRTQLLPTRPLVDRYNRAYRDSATAYLAGADTGWFSIWIFVEKDWKGSMSQLRGVTALVEDLIPGTDPFERAIRYAWAGAEKDGDEKRPVELTPEDEPALFGEDLLKDDFKSADDLQQGKADLQASINRFREGFLFYRNYVYDCARVFASLPRRQDRPEALIVRPDISVWTRPPRNPLVPGFELLNAYDALADLNQTPGLDLSRYRLIGVRHPGALRDDTIARLTDWLRDTPGLLYVHGKLTTDPADEASTPDDHDGILRNAWPWATDVTTTLRQGKAAAQTFTRDGGELAVKEAQLMAAFAVQGEGAKVLLSSGGSPTLVLWRKPGFRGAVLFDGVAAASQEYLLALRETLNDLHAREGIGLKLDGPILHAAMTTGPLTVAACTNYNGAVSETKTYGGVDFLTGLPNQPVGRGQATVAAREYTGRYVASSGGVAVLSERPLTGVQTIPGGLRVACAGLLRVGSETGVVSVATEAGVPLPVVEEQEVIGWILYGVKDGVGRLPVGATGLVTTYVRSAAPVHVTAVKP